MFKRIAALALALVLVLGCMPSVNAFGRQPVAPESVDRCCTTLRKEVFEPDYYRPDFEGKLIEITPQRVEDTFKYLDEHYVKNHPEQALAFYTGTEEDRANLLKLAQTITAGCSTDTQKADAIGKWISGNITYDVNTSAYASDTFYRREGNCLSYANLMMFLLRALGIPAVVGDGWRGNMKEMGAELFNMEGHAWVFVRLGGEWVLYDPLWLEGGTTDRNYMAEWIYFDTVEFITPVTDGDNLPPKRSEVPLPFWTNASWAKVTVIILNIWIGIPHLMLMATGILMNIPADLYESAKIDGAGVWKQYTKITLPYMLFVTGPYLLTSFIGNMNNFNVIYLLTGGGPSNLNAAGVLGAPGETDLLITWLFKMVTTSEPAAYNLASVIGIIVFIVVAGISLVVYNVMPSTKNEEDFQ